MQITARQLQIGLTSMLVAGTASAMIAVLFASSPSVAKLDRTAGVDAAVRAEVESVLRALSRAWRPTDRERVLAAALERGNVLAPALTWFLQTRDHDLLDEAVELAGALQIVGLRDVIAGLAAGGRADVRPRALRVAEALQSWSIDELETFLYDENGAVRAAAFQLVLIRDDAPWRRVFDMLLEADKALQEEVCAALPDVLPGAAVEALVEACDCADPSTAVGLAVALARGAMDPRAERLLYRMLREPDAHVVAAALDALTRKSGPLEDPGDVWHIVDDTTRPDALRARALRCLESTGSYDVDDLRDVAWVLPPLARYFAARCLLRADHQDGVRLLLEIVPADRPDLSDAGFESTTRGARHDDELAGRASRRLLSWLSGISPGASRDEFEDWFAKRSNRRSARHLPPSPTF